VSTERHGRWTAEQHTGAVASEPTSHPAAAVSQDVIDFIRYCYQRRRIGWPELYDEMCGVAARGEFRGMDYDCLAALGVRFSLGDMQRLAALAHQVVTEERRRRVAITVERSGVAVVPVMPALPVEDIVPGVAVVAVAAVALVPVATSALDGLDASTPRPISSLRAQALPG